MQTDSGDSSGGRDGRMVTWYIIRRSRHRRGTISHCQMRYTESVVQYAGQVGHDLRWPSEATLSRAYILFHWVKDYTEPLRH